MNTTVLIAVAAFQAMNSARLALSICGDATHPDIVAQIKTTAALAAATHRLAEEALSDSDWIEHNAEVWRIEAATQAAYIVANNAARGIQE